MSSGHLEELDVRPRLTKQHHVWQPAEHESHIHPCPC